MKNMQCIICEKAEGDTDTTFIKEEHIIPESLGNDKYILEPGVVCDFCNYRFSKMENKFSQTYPGVIVKVINKTITKKGKYASIQTKDGRIQRPNGEHIDIKHSSKNGKYKLGDPIELEPASSKNMSLIFTKFALELLAHEKKNPLNPIYNELRSYLMNESGCSKFVPFGYLETGDNNEVHLELQSYKSERHPAFVFGGIPGLVFLTPLRQLNNNKRLIELSESIQDPSKLRTVHIVLKDCEIPASYCLVPSKSKR